MFLTEKKSQFKYTDNLIPEEKVSAEKNYSDNGRLTSTNGLR